MPYLANEDEETQQGRPQSQYGMLTEGQMADPGPQPGATAQAPDLSGATGGFVNFDRYLGANKDVATRTAGELAGGVEQAAGGAQDSVTDLWNKTMGDVQAGTKEYGGEQIGTNSDNGNGTGTSRQGMEGTPQREIPGLSGPGGRITREEAASRGAQAYSGPMAMSENPGFDATTGQVENAAMQVGQIADPYGRQAMIQNKYGGTSGGSAMDSALTGAVGQNRFNDVQSKYANLQRDWAQTQKDAAGRIDAAKTASAAAAGKYKGLVDADDAAKAKENEPFTATKKDIWGHDVPITDPTELAEAKKQHDALMKMTPEEKRQYGTKMVQKYGNGGAVRLEDIDWNDPFKDMHETDAWKLFGWK